MAYGSADVEVVQPAPGVPGFKVIPRRWVVERTFGWLMHHRRLARDHKTHPHRSEAIIHVAMNRPHKPQTHPRIHPELARHLIVGRQSDLAGPDSDVVPCHTDLDPRPIDTFRQRRVGKIKQDQRATQFQDSPTVFGEAQLSTKDDATAVFPQPRGARGTWPGVRLPGDALIYGPLDVVFSPHCFKGPLPEHHSSAHC